MKPTNLVTMVNNRRVASLNPFSGMRDYLLFAIIIVTTTFCVGAFTFYQRKDPHVARAAEIGAFCGMIVTTATNIRIKGRIEANKLQVFKSTLTRLGYFYVNNGVDQEVYRPNLPWWSRWDSNAVILQNPTNTSLESAEFLRGGQG